MLKEAVEKGEQIAKTPLPDPCEACHHSRDCYDNISCSSPKTIQTWVLWMPREVINVYTQVIYRKLSRFLSSSGGRDGEREGQARRPDLWSPSESRYPRTEQSGLCPQSTKAPTTCTGAGEGRCGSKTTSLEAKPIPEDVSSHEAPADSRQMGQHCQTLPEKEEEVLFQT